MSSRQKIQAVYLLTLAGILIWIGAILLAPYLKDNFPRLSALLYRAFSPVCHQLPSRCFTFYGYPLAVCARCFGIYFGFFLGTCAYPVIRGLNHVSLPKIRLFLIVSFPIVTDTIGIFLGFWKTPDAIRFVFGVIWGSLLPFYFITGVAEFFLAKNRVPIAK